MTLRWKIIVSAGGVGWSGGISDHCHCSRLCSVQASAFQCQINWECFLKVSGCLVPVSSAGCTLLTAVMRQIRTSQPAARHGHYSNTPSTDDSWRSLCCDLRVNGDSALFRALMNIRAPLSLMGIKVWVRRSYLSAEAGRRMGAVRRW